MSEQINKELIKILNEISDNETKIYKLNASIFLKSCEKIINEKIDCLNNILIYELKQFNISKDIYFDSINNIITNYKEKIYSVYNEYYYQYIIIQKELQEARLNKKIAIINFQRIINNKEKIKNSNEYKSFINKKNDLIYKLKFAKNSKEYNDIYKQISNFNFNLNDDKEKKEILKNKNEVYNKISKKCEMKLIEIKNDFEKIIDELFSIQSKNLQNNRDINVLYKFIFRIYNLFFGRKKYRNFIDLYVNDINSVNFNKVREKTRDETVKFIEDIIKIKEKEIFRIGG